MLPLKAAVQAAQKAKTAFANASRDAVRACEAWRRNRAIRQGYNARARELKSETQAMRERGVPREDIARRTSDFRHNERMSAREQMRKNGDDFLVKKLEQRDLKKYGNKDGPDFRQVQQKCQDELARKLGRAPTRDEVLEEIIESSTRTDVWTNLKFLTVP